MTHRDVVARSQLVAKIKKIRLALALPADPTLDRLLFAGSLADLAGFYEGLQKMAAVFERNRLVTSNQ